MKKRLFGFVALAMTLASGPAMAYNGVGDIRSIDPCDEYGYKIDPTETPKSAGETVYFRIRLLNVNHKISYGTRNSTKFASPWLPDYNGIFLEDFSDAIAMAAWAMNPPKIGVYVSGTLRGATVKYPYAVTDDDSDSWTGKDSTHTWAGWYTDLICSYTVKPGDIALPMTLANSSGAEVGNGSGAEYYFDTIPSSSSVWRLRADEREGEMSQAQWDTHVDTNYCYFAFGDIDDLPVTPGVYTRNWTPDTNLRLAKFYIRTVDFALGEYTVKEGKTTDVTVNIVGGVNTNGEGTVYVFTKDFDNVDIDTHEANYETVTFSHSPAREMDGTWHRAKVTIPNGQDHFSFKVKGVTRDTSATFYLSSFKEFTYNDSGDLNTGYLTTTIKCEESKPSLEEKIDGMTTKPVTAGPDYETPLTLNISLSEPYTTAFDVTITPTMMFGSADPFDFVGVSTNSVGGYLDKTQTVHFNPGETSKDLYIYVLGGSEDTETGGIKFNPSISDAAVSQFFSGGLEPTILKIGRSTPTITYPEEDHEYNVSGGVDTTFKVKITDDYADLHKTYTVTWKRLGELDDDPVVVSNLVRKIDSNDNASYLDVPIKYPYQELPYTSEFTVKNASGKESSPRKVTVSTERSKEVYVTISEPSAAAGRYQYGEDVGTLSLTFCLTKRYNNSSLYAFLVPQSEAASNQVECLAFNTGTEIIAGETNSTMTTDMRILDGLSTGSSLRYKIVLRTAENWTDGATINSYASRDLYLTILNTAPVVSAVRMGETMITESGRTFPTSASVGLKKTFSLEADDVEIDRTNDVTSVWTFMDPYGNPTTLNVTAPVDEITTNFTFMVPGVYTNTVKLQDKDMSGKKFGNEFTFLVNVIDTPSLSIEFPDSNVYDENEAQNNFFYVKLSTPAKIPLIVKMDCTRVGDDGVLNLDTSEITFPVGKLQQTVGITDFDGTVKSVSVSGGFTVKATVVNPETDVNDDGIAWSNVYQSASAKVLVKNVPPQIELPIDYGITNMASIDVDIPIPWRISDVGEDMTNNLTIAWQTSENKTKTYTGSDVYQGVFTNRFSTGGDKTVTMTVTDKDGALAFITLYYKVLPSKRVNAYVKGPHSGGGLSALSKLYMDAFGRGIGRIWADTSEGGTDVVDKFAHKITYGESTSAAHLYGWGYKDGQVDDGNLITSDRGDIAISTSGSSFRSDDQTAREYYVANNDGYDSFFYAWVINSREEQATTYTGTKSISVEDGSNYGYYALALPSEKVGDDASPYYLDSFIEAFFSKELYKADNMGDMNADGIPDRFATTSWSLDTGEAQPICQAMTGNAITEEGESEGGSTASDLADVSTYNGDEDFFPAAWNSVNPLDPTVKDWSGDQPFTAIREIRGIGTGLNEPGVSLYDLTLAEEYALFADYAAASNVLTGVHDDDYVAATNWAASTGWTPEALNPSNGSRLNPLKADTDGDGFDDGWEYYFWYYAKIGAVTNGVWGRLEGRRFDIAAPATGKRIPSAEIAEAFNPHVMRQSHTPYGVDFDNDGLSDLEEYALGTNPCDWDSDRDGINDLWEVMNGLDPTSALDGSGNPDCDFMARSTYEGDTFTVYTFENGEMFGLPTATSPSFKVKKADAKAVWQAEFGSGSNTGTCWFAEAPAVIYKRDSNLMQLAADTVGYDTLTIDTNAYLGAERIFAAGTVLSSVAANSVQMSQAYVDPYIKESGGFSWRNPKTGVVEPTMFALPLFNYGGDGETYVPCVLDINQYSAAPVAPVEEAALLGKELPAGYTNSLIVKVEAGRTITLLHNQVLKQYGFDPRTAWNKDDYGYVDRRWRLADSESAGGLGAAGIATNTVPYTSRDEYLVMQYRQQMREIDESKVRSNTVSLLHGGDDYLLGADIDIEIAATVPYFRLTTTYPSLPVSFVRGLYSTREEILQPFDNSTNRLIVAYWNWLEQEHNVHGADSDFDGIPDGWELYINSDPNNHDDGTLKDGWAADGDGLGLLAEYAGVDSCNAYTNRYSAADSSTMIYPEAETITRHNPGKESGWWNKFFPTNPYDKDTDGDGVLDDAEGKAWKGTFYVGSRAYGLEANTDTEDGVGFNFIYGKDEHAEDYALDGSTTCFRGGGLNPCTVDTDGDLLPDAWEFQFAGIVFKDGQPPTGLTLDQEDLKILTMADGRQEAVSTTGSEIRGGMDGTWSGDSCFDFDHDGLANWQEYLVQSLRHLRYDDHATPLMGMDPNTKQFLKFIPFCAWDGEAFHKKCLESGFTGLGSWQFRKLGYFTRPPHEWDKLALNTTGNGRCNNYAASEGAGYRVMLPPIAVVPILGDSPVYFNGAMRYASTDPRRWDSDGDGMDDYYEIFHGLNPLLGTAGYPLGRDEYNWENLRKYDVIGTIHGGLPNAWCNFWTEWYSGTETAPAFDAVRYPWLIGTMECDADGDGLRNDEEALKINLAQPNSKHTDPTPLWMTDSTSADHASFTSQYYGFDPYITEAPDYDPLLVRPDVMFFPWKDLSTNVRGQGVAGEVKEWMFSFEENEGYDTDHDFKSDAAELTQGVELASDPQIFSDPNRRQALYFPGDRSAASTREGEFRRAVSTEPDLLKQFTVEFWFKPEGAARNAVLVERVCNYGASTLSNSAQIVRANFRIGVDDEGKPYGEFEGSTANSSSVRVTSPITVSADVWTHIAFTFDGDTALLYLNGALAPVAAVNGAGVIPANGIYGILQEYYTSVTEFGYVALPCATVLGANALNGSAIALDKKTTWKDFDSYFKGWIDEVRIWDGARTSAEIHANYANRFTMDDIKKMRTNDDQTGIYDQWASGARRSSSSRSLPAELLQHYNFVTLPGGVAEQNVLTEPVDFQKNVLDNVRKPNGKSLDNSLKAGWWSTTPVRSTVYWNYHVIPWIGNTVAHLPYLDGSSPDSQYWSSSLAGVILAASQKASSYDYPNNANPYPYYIYHRERYNRLRLLEALSSNAATNSYDGVMLQESVATLGQKLEFQLRSEFLGTSDLVPLGGAFAKRCTDFWDGDGSMDSWTETSAEGELADSDGNGIPDWAEALGLTTAEAYLRALANGLLPDGSYQDAYKSMADVNRDGLRDWWQTVYGLTGSAQEDSDADGLADFAEYLISEVFKFGEISPVLPKSNGEEFDYFRKAGKVYLGEIFADHDFMEDKFEREWNDVGADYSVYDAHVDSDEDGWSNWAEVRCKYDMGYGINESGVVTNIITDTGPFVGWWYYTEYKQLLESLLNHVSNCRVIDTDFTILGRDSSAKADSDEGFYGNGYIKYEKVLTYYTTAWQYREHPYPEVSMTVRYNGTADLKGKNLLVQAYTGNECGQCDATFTVEYDSDNRNLGEFSFTYPASGYLREGKNTFVVSVETVSNATEGVSGRIMGVVRNVDVGWKKASFEVELTETTPICPRPSIAGIVASNTTSQVYVYRYSVDGLVPPYTSLEYGPILVKDMGDRSYLHEGDFLSDADFDIDWSAFQDEVMGDSTVRSWGLPVTSVTYRVYGKDVSIDSEASESNSNKTEFIEFTRLFGGSRATAVPVAPGDYESIIYGACPSFCWRMEGDRPDSYTAFAIRIQDSAGRTVWTSGVQPAPVRDPNGNYVWKAPIYPNDQTTSGAVLSNTNNYTWSVTMLNSKYQSESWSATRPFRINVYNKDEVNNAGYYGIKAAVKYFGPGVVGSGSSVNGVLRVEAYTSPDFSGMPAGRAVASASLCDDGESREVTIYGLKEGTYYIRAFLDSDGDFKRSAWESWGYACSFGDKETGAIFAPTSVTVGNGCTTPTAVVYVEDADVDQDCLPDVWEYDNAGTDKTDFLLKKGPMQNTHNGYISVNPNLVASITDLINGGNSIQLLSAAPGSMPRTVAALMLGSGPSADGSGIDGDTLAIKEIKLEDGKVTLTLSAEAEDPFSGTELVVSDGMVKATVVIRYADKLDGEWHSVEKYIEKKIENGTVSEELSFSLSDLGLDASKGFFKVEVK